MVPFKWSIGSSFASNKLSKRGRPISKQVLSACDKNVCSNIRSLFLQKKINNAEYESANMYFAIASHAIGALNNMRKSAIENFNKLKLHHEGIRFSEDQAIKQYKKIRTLLIQNGKEIDDAMQNIVVLSTIDCTMQKLPYAKIQHLKRGLQIILNFFEKNINNRMDAKLIKNIQEDNK